MITIHNLGFPRIGTNRELKFALENYWKNQLTKSELNDQGQQIRLNNWEIQDKLDFLPVGDFSFYDQVLDCSFLLGNIPERITQSGATQTDQYFQLARGRAPCDTEDSVVAAGAMTKWFDSNYHYIVPELTANTSFSLHPETLLSQIAEAKRLDKSLKPIIIGPLTYLWLGKSKDNSHKLALLDNIIPVYCELLDILSAQGLDWVQIDEPILVTDLDTEWQQAFNTTYAQLHHRKLKILLATYFGPLQNNLRLACELPVQGLHIDTINAADEVTRVIDWLPEHKILSLGVIDGRNIWKTDLNQLVAWLQPIHKRLQNRLWLAPSCSLLHVPVDLQSESNIDHETCSWLAFAVQKLQELHILSEALNFGSERVNSKLQENADAIKSRQQSAKVHNQTVKNSSAQVSDAMTHRQSTYQQRAAIQQQRLGLPLFPTTTIGSFPQTQEIRQIRRAYQNGQVQEQQYLSQIKKHIHECIKIQESINLDVLVHGEAERNDMVEYFGQQLAGYAFSDKGWVQSYGSRCVKPPILYGDITRPAAITVGWSLYAQSLTDKPVKGMLTGPVTLLNWSFVRDDQARSETCRQLALAIREEVLDLEKAGIKIIQIDEAALREGLPLRKNQQQDYLDWAIGAFRLAANGVKDKTQIHTHMCYSQFNDILAAIVAMDADVISIETSRSDLALLQAFKDFKYPNAIGPGVYDIHSPNKPEIAAITHLISQASAFIPIERLWVNPDCGLKTRSWDEVKPALINMVIAANSLRKQTSEAKIANNAIA